MSEEAVSSDQLPVDGGDVVGDCKSPVKRDTTPSRLTGGEFKASRQDAGGTGDQQLSEVSEPAAEGEFTALKAAHAAEISALTEQVEALRDAVKEHLCAAPQEDDVEGPGKTAGVKESRHQGPRHVLAAAASQAGQTGSRVDVQEYLRVRRSFV